MKKRYLAILLALCLAVGLFPMGALAADGLRFSDVSASDWFYDSVWYVTQNGLMSGTSNTSFQPYMTCDRGMFVTILYRMEGSPAANGVAFLDVPEGQYYTSAVTWARANDIVKGYGDGRFGPNDPITREQMMLILYRYAEYKGYDVSITYGLGNYADGDSVSDYALMAVRWAVNHGLISGSNNMTLDPQGMVNRAMVAVFLTRFEEYVSIGGDRLSLSNFLASQTTLVEGASTHVTFTVRVNGRASRVALCRDDGVEIGLMHDDGRDGDTMADDGIYTFVWNVEGISGGDYNCYVKADDSVSRRLIIRFLAGGTITGKVCNAVDHNIPLSNSVLNVYLDGLLYTTSNVDAGGFYSLHLPAGSYHIEVLCDGYIPFNAYATVTGNSETYTETYLMVENFADQNGTASGYITSAVTGLGMDNVYLTVRKGWNNTSVGEVVATTYTDASGRYALSLPNGNYTIYAVKDGCIPVIINIVVTIYGADYQNGSITPEVTGGNFRVVLTWGESPRDMDSHVVGTDDSGDSFHVYYSHKNAYHANGEVLCNLDVDDTTSYGPETITLDAAPDKTYYYYVYQYSSDGYMSTSLSSVRVYQGSMLLATYNVPTNQGNGRYWNVFALKNGQIIFKHSVTSDPDLHYADWT